MHRIRLAARSARSVALCLPKPGARYALAPALPWQLSRAGQVVARGTADRVVLPLHNLAPATAYRFDRFAKGRMIDEKGMGNQPNLH